MPTQSSHTAADKQIAMELKARETHEYKHNIAQAAIVTLIATAVDATDTHSTCVRCSNLRVKLLPSGKVESGPTMPDVPLTPGFLGKQHLN